MAYIDALKRLEFLIGQDKGVDKKVLEQANQLISRSLLLQEEAYFLISKAYSDSSGDKNPELEDDIYSHFEYMENFDEVETYCREEAEKKERELKDELLKISRLEPSGFTETSTALHECAGKIVVIAKVMMRALK